MVTFSAPTSVLAVQPWSAFHQYFGGGFLIPEYRSWQELWLITQSSPDMIRGMAQHTFTAPFYAALGYSVGAWLSRWTALHYFVNDKIKSFEQRKFGSQPCQNAISSACPWRRPPRAAAWNYSRTLGSRKLYRQVRDWGFERKCLVSPLGV